MTDPATLVRCPVCKGEGELEIGRCPLPHIEEPDCYNCDICHKIEPCTNCDGTGKVTQGQYADNMKQYKYDYTY